MKFVKSKSKLLLVLLLTVMSTCNAQGRNQSYVGKLSNVIQRRINNQIDYLQSDIGIEDSVDRFVAGTIGIISLVAYIYLVMYIQEHFMNIWTGQHAMQVYYPGQIKQKISDVAGLAGAKADMKDIISYLKNPKMYTAIGAKVPKGVLMNGEPGNGKTLLAKAVAGEVNCPFININGSSFVQMYVGLGASRVRSLFVLARQLASQYGACIIFIDEIDAVASARGSIGSHSEHDQTLNALLSEMDGLDASPNPIIVIGATNQAHLLDEAIKRPGRFDRKVEITKPAVKDRVELLQIALSKMPHNQTININHVARITGGFSGAELANLINEAAILTANDYRKVIELYDIECAFDNITLGREICGMEQSYEAKWHTAIHEAGHTMALILLDKKNILHKSSIAPRSNTLGVMRLLPLHESYSSTEEDMKNHIVILLSGRLSEEAFGLGLSTGASNDLERSHAMAYDMVAKYGMSDALRNISYSQRGQLPNDIATQVEREVQKIINECAQISQDLIVAHKQDIDNIAKLLIYKDTVLGDEIYQLLGLPIPQIKLSVNAQ